MSNPARLDAFFHPRRIAIIGASEEGMYPAGILQSLQKFGFPGQIYPVNPRRATVFGLPAYPDVTACPQRPDLAIFTVPRRFVLPAIRQCVQIGVPAAVMVTAGFAEADEEGKQLQGEIAHLAKEGGLSIIGPNCAGLANIPAHLVATRHNSEPQPGVVSFASQSGALMMALHGVFADRRIGINCLISLGNQMDVTLSEALQYLAADESSQVLAAFIEGLNDGREFVAAARTALLRARPLVVLKSGRTAAGQQAAASHTAALAGSDRVFQAVCRQLGVTVAGDVRELMDTTWLMSAFGRKLEGASRVNVVTQSGGMGSLTADQFELAGIPLPQLSRHLQERLLQSESLLTFSDYGNPADVRGNALTGARAAGTLAPFMEDSANDLVLLLMARPLVREDCLETAAAVVETARRYAKPLAVVWVGQRTQDGAPALNAERILIEGGVPVFAQSSDLARALNNSLNYWRFRRQWLEDPERQALYAQERSDALVP